MMKEYFKRNEKFISQMQMKPIEWTKEDLLVWISEIVLFPEYIPYLKKKKINGSKFLKILNNKEKLEKIEIFKLGHIKLMKLLLCKMGVEFVKDVRKLSLDSMKISPRKTSQERMEKLLISRVIIKTSDTILSKKKKYRNVGIKKILKWDHNDISLWLHSIGLFQYNDIFMVNSIRGDILLDIEEKHLKEMGITAFGHIKKILKSIQKLDPNNFKKKKSASCEALNKAIIISPKVPSPRKNIRQWDVFQVSDWLKTIGLAVYSDLFIQEKIDGEVLIQLNKSDLEDLGISSVGIQKKIFLEIEEQKKLISQIL